MLHPYQRMGFHQSDFHAAQGTKWYFNDQLHWGFGQQNESINLGTGKHSYFQANYEFGYDDNSKGSMNSLYRKVNCDLSYKSTNGMCWPVIHEKGKLGDPDYDAWIGKGGTCGKNKWTEGKQWERMVFERRSI